MDEELRKKYPSLPENYVSLAQLKNRWLQKQEEERKKEQLEKQEELKRLAEAQKRENENDSRNTGNCKDEKNGKKVQAQKMGVKIGGFNGDGRMGGMRKERKRNKSKHLQKRKSNDAGKKGDADTETAMTLNEEMKVLGDNTEKNDLDGILGNEAVRISEGKISVKGGFTGQNRGKEKIEGFSRSNWNGKGYRRGIPSDDEIGRMEYKMKEKIVETSGLRGSGELKVEEKGSERIVIRMRFPEDRSGKRNGFGGGFNGSVRTGKAGYKLKEKRIEIDDSKGSEELVLDKKERERNECGVWFPRNDKNGRIDYEMKRKSIEIGELKVSEELASENKEIERNEFLRNGKNGRSDYAIKENRSGKRNGFGGGFSGSVRNGKTGYKLKEKGTEIDGLEGSEESASDKKERERNECGVGFLRNDENGRIDYEIKRKSIEIGELKISEELASENKEIERNEFLRNGKNGKSDYAIKDDGVEGEEINGNGITPEKVADEVLVSKGERNDAKGGYKNGFGRRMRREFGNLKLNDRKARNWAPRVGSYGIAGDRRMYGNRERLGNSNVNKTHVWVKKGENSDGNAAQIGFSGGARSE